MALRWDWNEKAGMVTVNENGREYTLDFYEGNALMITFYEYEEEGEERCQMQWFFLDEFHAKNCLGLAKGRKNMFGENGITGLTIYRAHCKNWKKLAELFTRAFPEINIHILYDVARIPADEALKED